MLAFENETKNKNRDCFQKILNFGISTIIRTYVKRKGREVCDNKKCEGIVINIIYVIFHLYVALYQVR